MKNKFLSLITLSAEKEALRKLVFSRPKSSEISKVSARLVSHRGNKYLSLEYFLPGNTVSQKNIQINAIAKELSELLDGYMQVNLITQLGDAEYKLSKKGKEALLGSDTLLRKLSGDTPDFEKAIESLDKRKNYILNGNEGFLIKLGVSDKNGRIHDKKQGKFRQINRFLEHIEALYTKLPQDRKIIIYDLCCGKSYLSFAVYHYLTQIKKRDVYLLGIDLKKDVITWCSSLARELAFDGMEFIFDDVRNTPKNTVPDMVISLHACDIATDIVLETAVSLGAGVILSTPCCHKYLSDRINSRELGFVLANPHLKNKLCDALTDALRIERLKCAGYEASAIELTDPENTPKNTLIKAVRGKGLTKDESLVRLERYEETLKFLLGEGAKDYLKEIIK